jgi:hypothetical protein
VEWYAFFIKKSTPTLLHPFVLAVSLAEHT